MRSRFVIIISNPTPIITNSITSLMRKEKVGFWHWFQSAWLITDSQERKASWWRSKLKEVAPSIDVLVLQVDDSRTWAGSGSGGEGMFEWLKDNWR